MFETDRVIQRVPGSPDGPEAAAIWEEEPPEVDPDDFATDEGPVLPPDLDSWTPGVSMVAFLGAVDVDALPPGDRLIALRAYQRLAAHAQAGIYRSMAAVAEACRDELAEAGIDDEALVHKAAEAEIGSALHLTRQAASTELGLAEDLRVRLPQVADALAEGVIDHRKARVIVRETTHLSEETARTVADQVLDGAAGVTTGQLTARIRRLAVDANPQEASERYQRATDDRRMVVQPTDDGTADVEVIGASPELAMEASDHVDRLARHLKGLPGESRTLDQLRADIAIDLLRGERVDARPGAPRPGGRVEIRVDLTTLAGLDDRSGDLAGYGSVIADIARQVALAASSWEFTVTDPEGRHVLHTGTTRRRPTAADAREVRARYPTCTFPGCRMPATRCDLDHRTPYSEGGPTCPCNLAPVCRYHHVVRHEAGWLVEVTADGDLLWTSPLGQTYLTSGRDP